MRPAKSTARWQAVCLNPDHRSFSTKPLASYVAAAAEMSREHPNCAFEMVRVTVGVKDDTTEQLHRLFGLSDRVPGD